MPASSQQSIPTYIGVAVSPKAESSELGGLVQHEINSRAARARLFRSSLFSDSAWDILLDLFSGELEGRRVQVTGVGGGARIASTTALRWLSVLESDGLIQRSADPLDRRRSFLCLTLDGRRLMTEYFERRLHLSIQAGLFCSRN